MPIETQYVEQFNPAFRQGVVAVLETVPPYRVRVRFPDRDNILSYWLPCIVPKIQDDKFFWQPDIGELVLCSMDEHDENGAVVGSMPNQQDGAPAGLGPDIFYIGFKDGTTLQYNRATHQMTVRLAAGASLNLSQTTGSGIVLDAAGNITFTAAASISFSAAGGATPDALALVSKLVEAFNTHTHGEPPTTGTPTVPWTAETVSSSLVKVTD